MIWSLLVVESVWLGYEILNRFAPAGFELLCVLAAAVPFGFTLVSWVFLGVRFLTPLNWRIGLVVGLLIFGLCAALNSVVPGKRAARKLPRMDIAFVVLMTYCSLLFFLIVDCSILKNGIGSSGTVFSDLPFHLGLITSFAYGGNSDKRDMITPFYAGESLSYPIIPDFFSSVLVGCGLASLRISIAVPTFMILMGLVVLLHRLASSFTGLKYAPEFAVFCFLYAGGVGWKWLFLKECRDDVNTNLAHCFCHDRFTFWIHPLVHFLLPQRSALFSMPIVVFITIVLIYEIRTKLSDKGKTLLWRFRLQELLVLEDALNESREVRLGAWNITFLGELGNDFGCFVPVFGFFALFELRDEHWCRNFPDLDRIGDARARRRHFSERRPAKERAPPAFHRNKKTSNS